MCVRAHAGMYFSFFDEDLVELKVLFIVVVVDELVSVGQFPVD